MGHSGDTNPHDHKASPLQRARRAWETPECIPRTPFLRSEPAMPDHSYFSNLIWQIADLLRGPYEINFNRHFYVFTPPRQLAEIDADLKNAEAEVLRLLSEVAT